MTTHLWASPPFTQTNNTDTAQSAQSLPRTNPGYGGLRPPWGQSLLRSYLATRSFPPPPPAEDALRAFAALGTPFMPTRFRCSSTEDDRLPEVSVSRGLLWYVGETSPPLGNATFRNRQGTRRAKAPSSGGWGREGARSEARAQQRLAPGGPQAPITRTMRASTVCMFCYGS